MISSSCRAVRLGPRYVDDLILRDRDATGGGDLGKSSSGLDERLYALTDALFNVVALINTSGAVQERFLYDPYGKSKVLDANFSDDADGVSDYNWEYRFTARRLDLDTGLQLNRNRYYHNALGRWVNRDPIGYRGGLNLYACVGGNPTNEADPEGLCAKPAFCDDPKRIEEIEKKKISGGGGPGVTTRCRVEIKCQDDCPFSAGYTEPKVRKEPGTNEFVISLCIDSDLSAQSQDIFLEHEMVHVRQLCGRNGGVVNISQCLGFERPAYRKSCKLAFPNDPKKFSRCMKCGLWMGFSRFNQGGSLDVDDPGNCKNEDVGITFDEDSGRPVKEM